MECILYYADIDVCSLGWCSIFLWTAAGLVVDIFFGDLQYIGYCTCDEESFFIFCNKHFCSDCIGQMDTYHFDSVSFAKCNFVFCI